MPQQEDSPLVTINGIQVRLNLDESLHTSVLRAFTGKTPTDTQVDELPVPDGPLWLRTSVRLLKWYRAKVSTRMGQRCVYEPTCSRYADLALRQHGFTKGLYYTLKRFHRCRPGTGGVDLP